MDIQDIRRQRLRLWLKGRTAPAREKSYFSQLLKDGNSFGERAARRLERDYGMGANYLDQPLAPGEAEVSNPAKAVRAPAMPQADVAPASVMSGALKGISVRPITTYQSLDELPAESTVLVTRVDVQLSAGNGKETWYIEEKEPLPFQADYIRRLDAKPKNLVAAKVRGDSMEPRLFDDDTVIVDRSDTRVPANGGVFALVYAGELLVKRLFQLPDGSIKVVSDNRDRYEPFVAAADDLQHILIIGRVKYRSGMGDF